MNLRLGMQALFAEHRKPLQGDTVVGAELYGHPNSSLLSAIKMNGW